jgi:AraC-like DNA-binding protein
MPTVIEAMEVDELTGAIAGLEVDYVRTGAEHGACRASCSPVDDAVEDVMITTGRMGFSTISHLEIPEHLTVFSLVTSAPAGSSWCGIEPTAGTLTAYGPGTPFVGINPAGLGATLLVASDRRIEQAAVDLGLPGTFASRTVEPIGPSPAVDALRTALWRITATPDLMDDPVERGWLLDAAVTAMAASQRSGRAQAERRLDSKRIVLDCIEFVNATDCHQPTMSELCRAACASQSRVRQAFVEVLDSPPMQYFQYRLLSRLRDELLHADPSTENVTRIASSLGVTQHGRIAGRCSRSSPARPFDPGLVRARTGRDRAPVRLAHATAARPPCRL